MNNKKQLLDYLSVKGKTNEESWNDLAKKFNFVNGEVARKFWFRNKNKSSNELIPSKLKVWETKEKDGTVSLLHSVEYKKDNYNSDEQDFKKEFLEFISESSKDLVFKKNKRNSEGITLVISLSDLHLDKYSNVEEVREIGDSQIQCLRAFDAINDILYRASKVHSIKKVIMIGGNDFFNANSSYNTTLKGTPVETSDRWHNSFKKGLILVRQLIDLCLNIAPVDFYTVLGNHDPERSWYLAKSIEAYYFNNDNVNIITTPSSRSYFKIGNSAFMLTHEVNNRALKNLPVIFVTEQSKMYAESKYRYVLTGHLHKTSETHFISTNEEYGLIFKIMPSLSSTDKWHFDNFYIGNQKSCIGLIIHDEYGLISEVIYNE